MSFDEITLLGTNSVGNFDTPQTSYFNIRQCRNIMLF